MTFAPAAPTAREGASSTVSGFSSEQTRQRCAIAARAASSKLGQDIVVLAVDRLIGLTDAFLVTSGSNPRQVRTIGDEIERQMKEAGYGGPSCVEGTDDARWVLMDFGDLVVHVFLDEAREFYDLERLWGDAPSWRWDDRGSTLVGGPV